MALNDNARNAIVAALCNDDPGDVHADPFPGSTNFDKHVDFLFSSNFKVNIPGDPGHAIDFGTDATAAIAAYFGPAPSPSPENKYPDARGWLTAADVTALESDSEAVNGCLKSVVDLGIWFAPKPGNGNKGASLYNGVLKRPNPPSPEEGADADDPEYY